MQSNNLSKAIKPFRSKLTVEDMVKEQNYQPLSRENSMLRLLNWL